MAGQQPTPQRGSVSRVRFSRRTRERIRAVDVLFEADQRKMMRPSALKELADQRQHLSTRQTGLTDGARQIVLGVAEHLAHIDYAISSYAERWRLDRMPATDRAILRVATWELLYDEGAQAGAVILEAVKIAQALSTDGSPKYVNGLLDTIASVAPGLRAQEAAFDTDQDALVAAALAQDETDEEIPDFHDGEDADFAAYGWGDEAGDFAAESEPATEREDDDAPAPADEDTDPTADFAEFREPLADDDFAPANEDTGAFQPPVVPTPAPASSGEKTEPPAPDVPTGETPPSPTSSTQDEDQDPHDPPFSSQLAANDPTDPHQASLFSDWEG